MRPKLRVAVMIGDRFLFGRAVYNAIKSCEDVEITHVLLPDEDLWTRDERTLLGPEYTTPQPSIWARALSALGCVDPLVVWDGVTRELRDQSAPVHTAKKLEPLEMPPGIEPMFIGDLRTTPAQATLRDAAVDIVISGAFPQLFPEVWCTLGRTCTLNVHPSPLPLQRGSQPLWWSIFDDEATRGVSVHRLDPGLDEGPLLVQALDPQPAEPTPDQLLAWACQACVPAIHSAFKMLRAGEPRWVAQDESRATLRRWPRRIHRKIHWDHDDQAAIQRKVRAGSFSRYPLRAYFFMRDRPIEIGRAEPQKASRYLTNGVVVPAGTVVGFDRGFLDVTTHDAGVLRLSELTLHGWPVQCDALALAIGQRAF